MTTVPVIVAVALAANACAGSDDAGNPAQSPQAPNLATTATPGSTGDTGSSAGGGGCSGEQVGSLPEATKWGNTANFELWDKRYALNVSAPTAGATTDGKQRVVAKFGVLVKDEYVATFNSGVIRLIDEGGRLCDAATVPPMKAMAAGKVQYDSIMFDVPEAVGTDVRAVVLDGSGKAVALFAPTGATDASADPTACTGTKTAVPAGATTLAFGKPHNLMSDGRVIATVTVAAPVKRAGSADEPTDFVDVKVTVSTQWLASLGRSDFVLTGGGRRCPTDPADKIKAFAPLLVTPDEPSQETLAFAVPKGSSIETFAMQYADTGSSAYTPPAVWK